MSFPSLLDGVVLGLEGFGVRGGAELEEDIWLVEVVLDGEI